MKKTALVLAIVLLLGMITLVSCGNACDGTYVYDSCEWDMGDDEISAMIKPTIISTVDAAFSQIEFKLKNGKVYYGTIDGTLEDHGAYTADGNVVTFDDTDYTYEDGKLTLTYDYSGTQVQIVFKKQ